MSEVATMNRILTQENFYHQRINPVIAHVRENLDGDLSLEQLAKVANLSPFHFHRVFKSIAGETTYDLAVRLRLAASLLRSMPKLSITTAALECGFGSLSVFLASV
jgi:AraC family transcriptional regulator